MFSPVHPVHPVHPVQNCRVQAGRLHRSHRFLRGYAAAPTPAQTGCGSTLADPGHQGAATSPCTPARQSSPARSVRSLRATGCRGRPRTAPSSPTPRRCWPSRNPPRCSASMRPAVENPGGSAAGVGYGVVATRSTLATLRRGSQARADHRDDRARGFACSYDLAKDIARRPYKGDVRTE
jgi:hypothetical protein